MYIVHVYYNLFIYLYYGMQLKEYITAIILHSIKSSSITQCWAQAYEYKGLLGNRGSGITAGSAPVVFTEQYSWVGAV